MTALANLPAPTRTVLRNVLLAFVVLDLLVLAAFSIRVDTITTTTTRPQAGLPAATTPGALPTAVPLPPAPPLSGGVPIADLGPAAPTVTGSPTPTPAAEPTTGPTSGPTLPDGSVRTTPCPIDIAPSTTDGGLQSLIDFAPAFGPFKDEAFAAAAAYQPVLQLIGPILAKYPAMAPALQPALSPLLGAWQQFLDQGFALLGPLYTPHRQAVLEAEAKLAAALAPYSQKLTASPLGGCVIALQNALLSDTGTATRTY